MSYHTRLTATGAIKLAAAQANATTVNLTEMAVGDGNGAAVPAPTGAEAALVHEIWRGGLSSLIVSPEDAAIVIAEVVIPAEDGSFAIRELGVFDSDGDLFAYGNFPDTYKPTAAEGSSREMVLQTGIRVASAASVEISYDPSLVTATRQWCLSMFLRQDANLSDVADAAAARANIGLSDAEIYFAGAGF